MWVVATAGACLYEFSPLVTISEVFSDPEAKDNVRTAMCGSNNSMGHNPSSKKIVPYLLRNYTLNVKLEIRYLHHRSSQFIPVLS
jgi:hypothetical protein